MIALWSKVIMPLAIANDGTRILNIGAEYGISTADKMSINLAMVIQRVQNGLTVSGAREQELEHQLPQLLEG